MHPLQRTLQHLDKEAARLRQLAADRREVTAQDPAADALDYSAGCVQKLKRVIESEISYLTVNDYASLHNVAPATVRRWIKANQLPADQAQSGEWFIRLTAVRRKPSHGSAID